MGVPLQLELSLGRIGKNKKMKFSLSFFAILGYAFAYGDGSVDDQCSIEDYASPNVASWRTNCPSGCEIKEYMDEMGQRIDSNWERVQTIMESTTNRMGGLNDYHVTLNQIKDLISKAMRELKKESDQFKKIQEIYNASDIPSILADQQIRLAELLKKKTELQINLSDTQKKFKEEAAFCKVSFREYDEQVCDILKYGEKYRIYYTL